MKTLAAMLSMIGILTFGAGCALEASDGNEESVGRALRDSGVPRNEVFLTTKFFPGSKDPVAEAEQSLLRLGVELRLNAAVEQVTDEDITAAGDQQAVGRHADAVAVVRRLDPLPHRPRHHPEHGAAVEAELAVGEQREIEVPQAHGGAESTLPGDRGRRRLMASRMYGCLS